MSQQPVTASTFTLGDDDLSFATDLYELTMAAAFHRLPTMPRATFELFVRRLPANRNFLVFAGLEQALASLVRMRFTDDQIGHLRSLPAFREIDGGFFDALRDFRFSGNVWAMAEGTVFFPGEPVLRVTGTLLEAQLVETLLLSIINFQTTIASKAARMRLAAGKALRLVEFGGRRAHGPQAAAWAARAAYIGGFDATSNVLAGQKLGIETVGTMAHSYIMVFDREIEAYEHFHSIFPKHSTFLVDTYDTLEGVRRALALDKPFLGIRLDSGDIEQLSKEAKKLLDEAGRSEVEIFVSGDLDEESIAALVAAGAPVDTVGVGTRLTTSPDSPFLDGIYKLVEVEEKDRVVPKFKTSTGKETYPGKKQVLRNYTKGRMRADRIAPLSEVEIFGSDAHLLQPVLRNGRILIDDSLEEVRRHCRQQLDELPNALRSLKVAEPSYPVTIDPSLAKLLTEGQARVAGEKD
jgi:nicotinate phosphoribosyltransferase